VTRESGPIAKVKVKHKRIFELKEGSQNARYSPRKSSNSTVAFLIVGIQLTAGLRFNVKVRAHFNKWALVAQYTGLQVSTCTCAT
jgi:hypothetical protein